MSRYFDRLTAILVSRWISSIARIPRWKFRSRWSIPRTLVATEQSAEVMTALDGALHKIEQQVRRHKDKRTERRRPPVKHLEVPAETEPEVE